MKVVWSETFHPVYSGDPAAQPGRLEAIVDELDGWAEWVEPEPAGRDAILRCHTRGHVEWVKRTGAYDIAALGGCPKIGIVARKWGSEAKLAYVRGE